MWTSGENCRSTLPPEIRRPFVVNNVNNEFIFCHSAYRKLSKALRELMELSQKEIKHVGLSALFL